jgi:hypothetical protein
MRGTHQSAPNRTKAHQTAPNRTKPHQTAPNRTENEKFYGEDVAEDRLPTFALTFSGVADIFHGTI